MNLPAMQETWVPSLGWEDPLKKGTASHSGLENSIDYTVHGIAQSQTQLSNCHVFLEGICLEFVIAGFFLNIMLLFFRFSDYCDFIFLGPLFMSQRLLKINMP